MMDPRSGSTDGIKERTKNSSCQGLEDLLRVAFKILMDGFVMCHQNVKDENHDTLTNCAGHCLHQA